LFAATKSLNVLAARFLALPIGGDTKKTPKRLIICINKRYGIWLRHTGCSGKSGGSPAVAKPSQTPSFGKEGQAIEKSLAQQPTRIRPDTPCGMPWRFGTSTGHSLLVGRERSNSTGGHRAIGKLYHDDVGKTF